MRKLTVSPGETQVSRGGEETRRFQFGSEASGVADYIAALIAALAQLLRAIAYLMAELRRWLKRRRRESQRSRLVSD
jgi:hypothetical protein